MTNHHLSDQAQSLRLGVYEHYKGNRYKVLGVVVDSETHEELVMYRALYGRGIVWARSLPVFCEEVAHEGTKQPRFRWVGEK